MEEEFWYTVAQLADRWRMNPETVRRMIRRGELEALELARKAGYRIRASEVERSEREHVRSRKLQPALARRADVWDASGGTCHYCGKTLHPFRDFHIDHVQAFCAGGNDTWENVVASCWRCNRRKVGEVDMPARDTRRLALDTQYEAAHREKDDDSDTD